MVNSVPKNFILLMNLELYLDVNNVHVLFKEFVFGQKIYFISI